jgi:hypothetical protein
VTKHDKRMDDDDDDVALILTQMLMRCDPWMRRRQLAKG